MQNKDYEKLMEKDGDLDIATLSKAQLENRFIKYSQITGGFIRDGEGEDLYYPQNPKLDTLMDIVEDSIDYTKITVFHNFVPEGRLIEKALDEKGIKYASMRSEIKDTTAEYYKFREKDDVKVMIAHPASGGIGLNFIVSSICIIYNIGN